MGPIVAYDTRRGVATRLAAAGRGNKVARCRRCDAMQACRPTAPSLQQTRQPRRRKRLLLVTSCRDSRVGFGFSRRFRFRSLRLVCPRRFFDDVVINSVEVGYTMFYGIAPVSTMFSDDISLRLMMLHFIGRCVIFGSRPQGCLPE